MDHITDAEQQLKPIEKLRAAYKTDRAVFAGACAVNGWKHGRMLTAEEYEAGIRRFVAGPANCPAKKEEG